LVPVGRSRMLAASRGGFRRSWDSRQRPPATLVGRYVSNRPVHWGSGLRPYQRVREV
jgi:hypothetical protein